MERNLLSLELVIQPSKLIGHILPVGQMAEDIAAARSLKAMKVVITRKLLRFHCENLQNEDLPHWRQRPGRL